MDWRIKQDGMVVASGNAEPETAKREAARYALVYAQDGPPVAMYYRTGKRWKFITTVEVVRDSDTQPKAGDAKQGSAREWRGPKGSPTL